MYRCKHFKIYELVDPDTYRKYGQKAWWFFDCRILKAADMLQEIFGTCTINDWKWGGRFIYSGYRPPHCPIGAERSDHKRGTALDLKFKHATPDEVREEIKTDWRWSQYITAVELNTPTWTHIAHRNVEPIQWIKP